MGVIEDYAAYLRDNPEGYWFKRKLYGFGFVPARWQGWAVILIFLAYLVDIARGIARLSAAGTLAENTFVAFLVRLVLASIILIAICFATGERPRWQWGMPAKRRRHE